MINRDNFELGVYTNSMPDSTESFRKIQARSTWPIVTSSKFCLNMCRSCLYFSEGWSVWTLAECETERVVLVCMDSGWMRDWKVGIGLYGLWLNARLMVVLVCMDSGWMRDWKGGAGSVWTPAECETERVVLVCMDSGWMRDCKGGAGLYGLWLNARLNARHCIQVNARKNRRKKGFSARLNVSMGSGWVRVARGGLPHAPSSATSFLVYISVFFSLIYCSEAT